MEHRFQFIKLSLLSIVFGVLTGVLSSAIIFIHLFSYMNIGEIMIGAKDSGQLVALPRIIDEETKKSVFNSLIAFYRIKQGQQSIIDSIYLDGDRLGYGFVITSDGWVVADEGMLDDTFSDIIAVAEDGKHFSIKKIEKDSKNGLVFVRLEASNLSPISFGDSRNLAPGEGLYVFSGYGRVDKVNFSGLGYQPPASKTSLFLSSEKFQKFIFFENDVTSRLSGAPLINYRGEVVGIVKNSGKQTTERAVPFHYVYSSMRNLFKYGRIPKLFLGIRYLDLSHTVSSLSNVPTNGALIISGGGGVGVLKYSPAWDAGLKDGDVILRVGGDELNNDYSLSDHIVEYGIGDTLDFLILRDGKENFIQVELGELQ